jgi:hypothetical protein
MNQIYLYSDLYLNFTDSIEENESYKNTEFTSLVPAILHTSKVLFIANATPVCGQLNM